MRTLTALSLAIPILLQACIAALLLWRKLQKRFLWFFIYIVYELFVAAVQLAVSGNTQTYLVVYWSTAVPGVALTVLALRESFLAIFLPETRLRWFRWVFWSGMGIILGYAGLRAWLYPPHEPTRLGSVIIDLELGVQYLIAAIGLVYFGLIRLFNVIGHQRESGIIWGFGMNATLIILGVLVRSIFVTKLGWLSTWLPALAYIIAEVSWMTELLRQERRIPEPKATLEEMNEAIDRYTAIMNRYLGREA